MEPSEQSVNTTVAAVATAAGIGALSVIRMTGPDSPRIADSLFVSAAGAGTVADMPSHTCRFGRIVDPDNDAVLDEVVLTRFRAPRSYTGEDMVEISCHGGNAVRRCILDALFAAGAQPAEAGAFTRRAFLNGKMDLSQAEAVMDLISSAAARTVRAAAAQLDGALSRAIRTLTGQLYAVIGRLEMSIEYPEYEEAETATTDIQETVRGIAEACGVLYDGYRQGRLLKEGMTVVIAGRPNVGKSSLLNRLAGFDRAIVTEIAGTTRDTVEELVEIRGLPVRLVDTAGIRDTDNRIEREGISRAQNAMRQADLVLWVSAPETEGDVPPEQEAKDILAASDNTRLVLVTGKQDTEEGRNRARLLQERLRGSISGVLPFSAKTGDGLDAIRAQIQEVFDTAAGDADRDVVLLNARHAAAVRAARDLLSQTTDDISELRLPEDLVSAQLQAAAETLASITGENVSDRIVETIFSRFCVGK